MPLACLSAMPFSPKVCVEIFVPASSSRRAFMQKLYFCKPHVERKRVKHEKILLVKIWRVCAGVCRKCNATVWLLESVTLSSKVKQGCFNAARSVSLTTSLWFPT